MYEHVMVPLDGSSLSEAALAPAAELARRTRAVLVLYTRIEDDRHATQAEADLLKLAEGLDDAAVMVTAAESAAAGIEQAARSLDESIVCMSTHGRGGIGRSVLGSVAEDVLGRIGGPIVLVGPHADAERPSFAGLLVTCLDGSDVSEAILEPASQWAKTLSMTMVLVHVDSANLEADRRGGSGQPDDAREDAYLSHLSLVMTGRGVERSDWVVLRHDGPGNPADRIVEYVRNRGAGLVALGTHGRTGLQRLVIGSVAMRVVHDSPCPVLVFRPADLPG